MKLHSPAALRAYLEAIGTRPSKRLSQNFLIDGNILKKIAAAANSGEGDLLLEVGPGPGALTDVLLETGAQLLAVEKDEKLAAALRERLADNALCLEVATADILEYPFEERLRPLVAKGKKIKVVANLPYHLTTPIIEKLLEHSSLFSCLVLMVQEEVARRMTAKPGCAEYGSLTLFLNYWCHPTYGFKVSRRCFYPAPGVDSAVVVLTMKAPPAVSDPEGLFKMMRSSFQQRRKMLRNSLVDYEGSHVAAALEKLGLDSRCRGEELSLEQFIALYELLV